MLCVIFGLRNVYITFTIIVQIEAKAEERQRF